MDPCVRCGAECDGGPPDRMAWAYEPPDRWLCPDCARRHVRDIEAKLATGWWTPDA